MRNCLTYALGKFIREGGYLVMRKSHIASFHGVGRYHPFHLVPHFLHMDRKGAVTQLGRTPEEQKKAKELGPLLDWMWLWHFEGHIITGDDDDVVISINERTGAVRVDVEETPK
jgi:hypothetical protein